MKRRRQQSLRQDELLARVLREEPERCDVRDARDLVMRADCKRGRTGEAPGRLALEVPDAVLLSLVGPPGKARFGVLLVVVAREPAERPLIVTPRPRIILPGGGDAQAG